MRKGAKTARKRSREVLDPLDRLDALLARTERLLAGDREIDSLFEDSDDAAAATPCVLSNANDQKRVPELCRQILQETRAIHPRIDELREALKRTEKAALQFQRRLIEDHKLTMIGGSPHTEPDQRMHTIVYSNLTIQPSQKAKRRKKNKKSQ